MLAGRLVALWPETAADFEERGAIVEMDLRDEGKGSEANEEDEQDDSVFSVRSRLIAW